MERVSDEQLLRMLQQVDTELAHVETIEAALDEPELEPIGDPCSACGEPAEQTGICHVCGEEGCLPSDLWMPGMADPCLTLCVRCARTIHLGCSVEDGAGNPRCASCKY